MSDDLAYLAHLADDPAAMHILTDLYIAGYLDGAFTALYNIDPDQLAPTPAISPGRGDTAANLTSDLRDQMLGDPAITLTLERGITALLRGEEPAPNMLRTAR